MRKIRAYALTALSLLISAGAVTGASGEYEAGLALLKQGRPANALPLLEAARRREPASPDVLYALAGCYFALNRGREGLNIAAELARRNPKDPAILLAAGSLMTEHGDPKQAVETFLKAEEIAPGNPLVLNALASAQYRSGDSPAAVESLERLLSSLRSTLRAETRAALASACLTAHALRAEDRASLRIAMVAAELDLLADRPQEAWETLRSLDAAGGGPDYYKLLGLACARLGRLPEAIRAGQQALRLAPTRQDLLLNLAAVYQKARDNPAAIHLLRGAVGRGVVSPEIHFALALSQFNSGDYGQTMQSCGRALALNPKFDRAALLKGRALEKLSRRREAIEWFRRALESNPACEYCRYKLALALVADGRLAEAEPLLREVVATTPPNVSAQYELAKLLDTRGNAAEAIAVLESVVASNPDQDNAWYLLGRIYLRNGNRLQAERAMAAVKEIQSRRRRAAEERLAESTKSASH
jgi:tetratricopeptide (TPR) repeat protein